MASEDHVLQATRRWLERAVIGLNLCPFARAVHAKGQIRYRVSRATEPAGVLEDLEREAQLLAGCDAAAIDTTLLIVPGCLGEFLEFNDLVRRGERLLRKLGMEGVLQLASFHPHYQFAGAGPDDIANCSNRSPYPVLHLLREASVARAVRAFPDAAHIYERNIETLRRLGPQGWAALDVGPPQ